MILDVSEFLQLFSPFSLHHSEPKSYKNPWVFWSESDGFENNSWSAYLCTPPMFHHNIKSALSNITHHQYLFFGQFWAPVTIDGRRLLSTSNQPFSVRNLYNSLAIYRLHSEKYKYNIDVNNLYSEPEHMILSGGPATAFLNCRTSMDKVQGFPFESVNDELISVMFPICFPFQSNCIGVLEFTLVKLYLPYSLLCMVEAIKDAGLDVFYVQHLIPYKAISGLEVAKDEIEEALKVVCQSHNLALAQVWIPYEDTNNVPFSYSLEDTQTKRLSVIKLTGYLYAVKKDDRNDFEPYFRSGDVTMQTFQDYESRFISVLRSDMLVDWEEPKNFDKTSTFAICLRSDNTGDLIYMFEFIWTKHSNYIIFLEAILLTMKRCLPRFKFASGAEIGNELDVILVYSSQKFKIFQEKRSSPTPIAPEKGMSQMVVDLIAPSMVTCKTAPKVLPPEVIEKQFGKTMKEAAKDLNVSLSTLKRKVKELKIREWPGPNVVKRNRNDSSIIQTNTNEEDNGAIEETSTVNLNKNVLTIKAEYADYMIKFHLPISQATFVRVEKEIGMKLKLSDKTYKLKYLDEDGDWIILTSDEEMADCIKSSRKLDRIVVRLRVVSFLQPISGPSASLGTFFI
ncbi:putative transcription factor Nin-like family [Helianthus anomalus]